MQLVVPRPHLDALTLRRHPLVLLPRMALLFILLAALVVAGIWLRVVPLVLAGVLVCGGAMLVQITAWWMFTITIRYDRVKVRRLRGVFVRQTTFTLPGLRGLTYEQQFFEKMVNAGTVVLNLPEGPVCFTMLTPYSALDTMLGWG